MQLCQNEYNMLLFGVYQNKTLMPLVLRVSAAVLDIQTIIQTFKGLDDTCTYGTVIGEQLISKAFTVKFSDLALK